MKKTHEFVGMTSSFLKPHAGQVMRANNGTEDESKRLSLHLQKQDRDFDAMTHFVSGAAVKQVADSAVSVSSHRD